MNSPSQGKSSGSNKAVKVVIAIIAIIASGIYIARTQFKPVEIVKHENILNALAQGLSEQTAKVLGGRGQIVIVSSAVTKDSPTETLLNAFKEAVVKTGEISIIATETVAITTYAGMTAISAESFLKVFDGHSGVSAIVSLSGVPTLADADMARLSANRPKIIVYSPRSPNLKKYLQAQIIDVAIVPRKGPGGKADGTTAPAQNEFDRAYQVYTLENASELFQ